MNATSSHSKVRVTASVSAPVFVAGGEISGKMEMDCRTDKGLGISEMMVELVAVQELTSRDHSATSTFMHSKRIFQGPGLPPSNAVFAHPQPGAPPLPPNYYQAKKGCTTFFFNFPLPQSSPNSINFGNGLARIFYEIRATAAVWWKGERTSVRFNREVVVVECLVESRIPREPSTLVAEGGKMVVQAQVVGGIGVTSRPTCVELQVKNHSHKKTTGLTLTLTRTLHLPNLGSSKNPFQITDTVVTVPFRGAEYTIGPGVEGVANLVFEVPRAARGVKGGTREMTDDGSHRHIEALFDVQTAVTVTIGMGVGSKDIKLEIPLTILHPLAVPEPAYDPYQAPMPEYLPLEPPRPHYALPPTSSGPPSPASYGTPPLQYQHAATPPHMLPYIPQVSPVPMYAPQHYIPPPQHYAVSPTPGQQYYFPPPPIQVAESIARPTSAVAMASPHSLNNIAPAALPPLPPMPSANGAPVPAAVGHTEEGKGERASRISLHLKTSSRGRSASPTSHRYRISGLPPNPAPLPSAIWGPPAHLSPSTEVLSPRPMLSPKASFSGEPAASPGQSGRVAALEKMVEEEERARRTSEDQQRDEPVATSPPVPPPHEELEAAELAAILDKTLPVPPATFAKPISKPASRTLANIFEEGNSQTLERSAILPKTLENPKPIVAMANLAPAHAEETPKVLVHPEASKPEEKSDDAGAARRTKAVKRISVQPAGEISSSQSAVGLDALEKRLIKEVGTRKPAAATLQYLREMDNKLDEAIQERNERQERNKIEEEKDTSTPAPAAETEKLTTDIVAGKETRDTGQALLERRRRRISHDLRVKGTVPESTDKANQRKGPSKQEEEQIRLRRMAKGRVTAWLDSAEVADPPPLTETRIVEQAQAETGVTGAQEKEEIKEKVDPSKVQLPARTSSGFLPIRPPVAPRAHQQLKAVAETTGVSSPPQEAPLKGIKDWRRFDEPKPVAGVGYDVRSARGGRGGRVTSVAAIWAEKVNSDAQVDPKKSPPPKGGVALPLMVKIGNDKPAPIMSSPEAKKEPLKPLALSSKSPATSPTGAWLKVGKASEAEAKERGNLVKAPSVPAKLSSSIASPLLSSTASLARPIGNSPTPPREYVATSPKLGGVTTGSTNMTRTNGMTTSASEPRLAPPSSKPAGGASIAFGQGRLRDLIAKYQQGATTN